MADSFRSLKNSLKMYILHFQRKLLNFLRKNSYLYNKSLKNKMLLKKLVKDVYD